MGSALNPALLLSLVLAASLSAQTAWANAQECVAAVRRISAETRVPADVLLGITLTETGRTQDGHLQPWPWTANFRGRGHWFETRADALAFARARLANGQRSFDLGCFQINWRWHGDQFQTPADLLDPVSAGRYAAQLLRRFFAELGSWERAAGAYHSRTPRFANRYRARFREMRTSAQDYLAQFRPGQPVRGATPARPRANAFPLLIGGTGQGASLVPTQFAAQPRPFVQQGARP